MKIFCLQRMLLSGVDVDVCSPVKVGCKEWAWPTHWADLFSMEN